MLSCLSQILQIIIINYTLLFWICKSHNRKLSHWHWRKVNCQISTKSNISVMIPRHSCVDGKHFENAVFRKRWHYDIHVISLPWSSSNTNPKWAAIAAFSDFSGVAWTENIWCVFRVKTPFQISPVWCRLRLNFQERFRQSKVKL